MHVTLYTLSYIAFLVINNDLRRTNENVVPVGSSHLKYCKFYFCNIVCHLLLNRVLDKFLTG